MLNIQILMTISIVILVFLNVFVSKVNNKGLFNVTNLFLFFFLLNIIDIAYLFGNDEFNLKLNYVFLAKPNSSLFIVLSLNLVFLISMLYFLVVKNPRICSEKKNCNMRLKIKKIPKSFYVVAFLPTILIAYNIFLIIMRYGVLGYMMNNRSGNWSLIAIAYSTIAFSIIRSIYYKRVDFINALAIGVYFITYPTGATLIRYLLMCLVIIDTNIKRIKSRNAILLAIIVVLLYPLTKIMRTSELITIERLISEYDITQVFKIVTNRSHGASVQIAIVDYCNNNNSFTYFIDYFHYIFTFMIPRSIYANKPVIYGTALTNMFTYDQFVKGTSLAPSIIGYIYHAVGGLTYLILPIITWAITKIDNIKDDSNQSRVYAKPFLVAITTGLVDGNFDGFIFHIVSMIVFGYLWYALIVGRKIAVL